MKGKHHAHRPLLLVFLLALTLFPAAACRNNSPASIVAGCTFGTECICALPRKALLIALPVQGSDEEALRGRGVPREVALVLAGQSGPRWCSADARQAGSERYSIECVSSSVAINTLWVGRCSKVAVRMSADEGDGRKVLGVECRDDASQEP